MAKKNALTQEGYDKLVSELNELKFVKRPKNIQAIKEARAQGDLSENADYDAARNEQAQIEHKIKELESILKDAVIIKSNRDDICVIGNKVELKYLHNKAIENIQLVGSQETDLFSGSVLKISVETPLGRAIQNHKAGDKVSFKVSENKSLDVEILKVYQ